MAVKKTATPEPSSTAVVVAKKNMGTLLKGSVGTLMDLNKEAVEKALKDLVKKHKKRIDFLATLTTLTKAEFEDAVKINAEIRGARYTLQNVGKNNTSVLNAAKKNNGLIIDELIELVEPTENIIYKVIEDEKNRKENEKAEKERVERERTEAIEGRIVDAGTELEKLITDAKKSKDWTLFDAYYTKFEEDLETLEELEFEGRELLDRALEKKNDVLATIAETERLEKEATAQAERQKELDEAQAKIDKDAAAAEENKRRLKVMFGIGFMFNGSEFFKGESTYSEKDIQEATPERFGQIVKIWQEQIDEAAKAAKEAEDAKQAETEEQAERTTLYNELIAEAGELELDVKEYKAAEPSLVSQSQLEDLQQRVIDFNTEQGRIAEEKRKEEARAYNLALKEAGLIVVDAVEEELEVLKVNVSPEALVNEAARKAAVLLFYEIDLAFNKFKESTHQNITIE